jgi:hypothetical protein
MKIYDPIRTHTKKNGNEFFNFKAMSLPATSIIRRKGALKDISLLSYLQKGASDNILKEAQ